MPRLKTVVARGEQTLAHLNDLQLPNVTDGSDLAFLMKVGADQDMEGERLLEGMPGFVIVNPSVVKALCDAKGINNVSLMASTVEEIIAATGLDILIFPHSARVGYKEGRMNDIPIGSEVYSRLRVAGSGAGDVHDDEDARRVQRPQRRPGRGSRPAPQILIHVPPALPAVL